VNDVEDVYMTVRDGGTAPRTNVALMPKSVQAMEKLQERTHLNQTDIVNRALQLYADLAPYVEAEDGRAAYIQEPDGELQKLRMF
jgi:hypothetical protein